MCTGPLPRLRPRPRPPPLFAFTLRSGCGLWHIAKVSDTITLSRFASTYDKVPKPLQISWQALKRELVSPPPPAPGGKEQQHRISPAEYLPGAAHESDTVRRATFLMLDFDKLSYGDMAKVLRTAKGLDAVMYTTWSHPERYAADGSWSFRLALALSRPVDAKEWPGFHRRVQQLFDWLPDPQCASIRRPYIFPIDAGGGKSMAFSQEGKPVPVDAIMSMPAPPEKPAGAGTRRILRGDLQSLASSLARRVFEGDRDAARAIKAVVKGEPFAEPGDRESAMYRMASAIARQWPDLDVASVSRHFMASIAIMSKEAPECPTIKDLEGKLRRCVTRIAEDQASRDREAAERAKARSEEHAARIQDAFGGKRSHPYTEEELDLFKAGGFAGKWVVQSGSGWYLYKDGRYMGPVRKEEVQGAAHKNLAPASTAGVDTVTWNEREGTSSTKSPERLLHEYGTHVSRVVIDMTAERSHLDIERDALVEAPCPLRDIQPRYDGRIDRWLRAMAGSKSESLMDWLAVLPRLEEPTAALYLEGPPDAGKSFLIQGLARLWSEASYTRFKDAVSDFNERMLSCPLLGADETISRDKLKGEGTGIIRELIQGRGFMLHRKYQGKAHVRGAIRLIIAGNNRHLLDTGEELMANDTKALCERILYIEARQEAVNVLRSFGKEARRGMVDGDGLAAHVLWLRDNRHVEVGSRFLVEGQASELTSTLVTSYGLRSAVCHWLVSYLMERGLMDNLADRPVRVAGGRLLVTYNGLMKNWDMYGTNEKPPTVGRLRKALAPLKEDRRRKLKDGTGRYVNYHEVKLFELLQWAEDNSDWSADQILESLKRDTPEAQRQ